MSKLSANSKTCQPGSDANKINYSKQSLSLVICKCQRLVGVFKHNKKLALRLEEKRNSMKLSKVELIQNVSPNWTSTCDMIASILDNKQVLQDMLEDNQPENELIRPNMLTGKEFDIIRDLFALLAPVREITAFLSEKKIVSCSIVYPAIFSLINYHLDMPELTTPLVSSLRKELKRSLNKQFSYLFDGSHGSFFRKAAFLDFNYKKFEFVKDEALRAKLLEEVKKEIIDYYSRSDMEPSADSETISVKSEHRKNMVYLDMIVDKTTPITPRIGKLKEELSSFISFDISLFWSNSALDSKYDSFIFYRKHASQFPMLASLAKNYLAVPATSVPAEVLFSRKGIALEEIRNRLHPSDLDLDSIARNYF
jgi:hypothetical protein